MVENETPKVEVSVPVEEVPTTGLAQVVEEEGKPVGAASVVDMDVVDPFPPHDENITS